MLASTIQILIFANCTIWCSAATNTYQLQYEENVDQDDSTSSNRLTENERSTICGEAMEEAVCDLIKCREVQPALPTKLDNPTTIRHSGNPTAAHSFTCPKLPGIRISVEEDENKNKSIRVHIPRKYISFSRHVRYRIKSITRISEATKFVDTHTNRFAKENRLKMCRSAFTILSHKNITWLTGDHVGEIQSYEWVERTDGEERTEGANAFQCPIEPAILVTMPELVGEKFLSWLVIEEKNLSPSQGLGRFAPKSRYVFKSVNTIEDYDFYDDYSLQFDENEPVMAVPPEYDENERRQICHEASEIIPDGVNLLSWSANELGEERIYEIGVQKEWETADPDGEIVYPDVVIAFECPTDPPLYPQTYVDADMKTSIKVFGREQQFSVLKEVEKMKFEM